MGILERKEREKEHRREEILDAAQVAFFERGLATATMDEIAEKAELSKGTLYLYYKSKEDLYLAVMMRGMQILYDKLAAVIDKNESAPKTIAQLGRVFVEFFDSNKNYFRMLHFLQTPQLHKQASEEMKASCSVLNHRIMDLVHGVFHRGIREGTVRSDLNATEIFVILWSSATALIHRIDNEYELWRDRFHIDLRHTLEVSNELLFESIFTEEGRRQLREMRVP